MRSINKGVEPTKLARHRQTLHSDYDNFQDKNVLRQALVTEQRELCCYCMGRISSSPTSMKIEHWLCQTYHSTEQLNYKNLLGACLGGQGLPPEYQHCDTRKGDRALMWNPAAPSDKIESRIYYEQNGAIRGNQAAFDDQLDKVLNLNLPLLKKNRQVLFDAVLEWWRHEKARLKGPVPLDSLIRKRDRCVGGNGKLEPYCQVTVWLLEQRIAKKAP